MAYPDKPIQGRCIHSESGAFGEVRVFENDSVRWLQFDNDAIQSVMSLQYPERITVTYMQQMMACLLFSECPPKNALLLGLGGGTLLRFLQHCLKHIDIEVVERDAHVIRIAHDFFNVVHNGEDIIIEHELVDDYLAECERTFDLVILDIIEDVTTPPCFFEENFFSNCRKACGESGVLVVNLLVETENDFKKIYLSLRHAFDGRVLCMTDPNHRNIVLLAFAQQPRHLHRQALLERAELLKTCQLNLFPCIATLFEVNPSSEDKLLFTAPAK
jgi:spermidine synthase